MPVASPEPSDADSRDQICGVLEVFQGKAGYRFGIETLLLCGFVSPGIRHLVDLGTGCGVIALVLVRFGKAARAVGVEIQPAMAARARRGVLHNRLAERIEIVEADLRDLKGVLPAARFDAVVANPPYRKTGAGHSASGAERATGREELLCTFGDVVRTSARLLRPRGRFAAVFPVGRLPEMLGLCREHGLCPSRLRLVFPRLQAPSKTCLLEAVRGGRMALFAEPPLVLYDAADRYTAEVQAMLYPAEVPRP
jgi:tRNA1Val (adenine37-N6)-methyltransferase